VKLRWEAVKEVLLFVIQGDADDDEYLGGGDVLRHGEHWDGDHPRDGGAVLDGDGARGGEKVRDDRSPQPGDIVRHQSGGAADSEEDHPAKGDKNLSMSVGSAACRSDPRRPHAFRSRTRTARATEDRMLQEGDSEKRSRRCKQTRSHVQYMGYLWPYPYAGAPGGCMYCG